MNLELLTNEQATARSNELLGYQMVRPSHRVVNLYDTKNNTLILTEWQDWMVGKNEDFGLQCQKNLALETGDYIDDIFKMIPTDVRREDPMLFRFGGVNNSLFFLITDNRYFVIGRRKDNNRILENDLDGMELLAEVGAEGEFRFAYLPRFGFCIRALNHYEFRSKQVCRRADFFNSPGEEESDFNNHQSYSGLYMLINTRGEAIFEDFAEDNDLLRIFLGTPNEINDAYARRLRYWAYPTPFDLEGSAGRVSTFYRGYGGNSKSKGILGTTPNVGAGTVDINYTNGTTLTKVCVPWCEYAFDETFYGD